jgi:acetyl esterase/lipase
MKKLNKFCVLTTVILWTSIPLLAQEQTIKLWPQAVPGSIDDPSYKQEIVYVAENIPRIYRVTDPVLDVYPAAKEKASGSAMVICPGGGYARLAADKEGRDVSLWLNSLGITAFVLKYRLPSDDIMKDKSIGPLQDAQEAIRFVRRNNKKWDIARDKIGIMGFSAGGHLASTLATHFDQDVYQSSDTTSARPDFSILVYPVISMDSTITHQGSRENLLGQNPSQSLVKLYSNELQVTTETSPAFIVHAFDDTTVPVENSIRYALALKNHNIPVELHLYEKGGHGFGLAKNRPSTESNWTESCLKWLRTKGYIK